ncbi:hypothetical protein, partial [Klebsiella pneumoniae]
LIPGCKFRVDEEGEIIGVDEVELGEWAYDYIQLRREVDSTHGFQPRGVPPHTRPHDAEAVAAHLPSAHVKPSSINSSEVRLRHEH